MEHQNLFKSSVMEQNSKQWAAAEIKLHTCNRWLLPLDLNYCRTDQNLISPPNYMNAVLPSRLLNAAKFSCVIE